ncbi:MAG: OmpA family protein [Bacteroidaceae bacterium]|nr:OmpA family protein [Bacteroidaceae bacterium]
MKTRNLTFFVLLAVLCSSCVVGRRKYDEAEAGRLAALYSRDSLGNLLMYARQDCNSLVRQCQGLIGDTLNLGQALRLAQRNNATLTSQLSQKNTELGDRERTIAQLQQMVDEQNARVKSILDNVKQALNGFSSDELSIREEGGKVYVAMSDKLLFESGSANVNDLGRQALGKLATVLNRQADVDVYIEGHTDSIPIHTAVFKDNWDLSVIRSTSVVRILTETYNVNPLQIQPCGRGEYKPMDTNATPEGRARNRRTEIIIAPKLDKLYQMLKQ